MKPEELRDRCKLFIRKIESLGFVEVESHYSEEHFGDSYLIFMRGGMQILIATDRGDLYIDIRSSLEKNWLPLWLILTELGVDESKLVSGDGYEVYTDNIIFEFLQRPSAALERVKQKR